jgi:multiple sugar transport system substrate-binding protein
MSNISHPSTDTALPSNIKRRDFLKGMLAVGAGSAISVGPVSRALASPKFAKSGQLRAANSAEAVGDLTFTGWSYGVSTIESNISTFEKAHPGVKVSFEDFSWSDYDATMVARFVGQTPTDVCYSNDAWLQQWAAATWIHPIAEVLPAVNQYATDFFPYVRAGMTFNNKLYGVPYYADTWAFLYNEDHLKKAGIAKPPATWDELTDQAKQIKAKGIAEFPVILTFSEEDPDSTEVWQSMVFSLSNGHLFDKNNNAVFNHPGSALERTIEWIASALHDSKILDPGSLVSMEIPTVTSMASGANTFTILETYNQAALNKSGSGKYAGKFKMAEMPGDTHNTVGYVRFYAVTNPLLARDKKTIADAANFLNYFGGKVNGQFSPVVVRWAVEEGLGFGWESLWDDPKVVKAFSTWGDPAMLKQNQRLARLKEGLTSYYPQFDIFARAELQKAYTRSESAQACMSALAKEWEDLKAES